MSDFETTVEFEVYLPMPINGESLVAAVKAATGSMFEQNGMIIGQSSDNSDEDCVIAVG